MISSQDGIHKDTKACLSFLSMGVWGVVMYCVMVWYKGLLNFYWVFSYL